MTTKKKLTVTKRAATKQGGSRAKTATTSKFDIIELVLEDHKPLKALIKVMKGEKPSYADKKAAFKDFAPLLVAHAKPEEQTWYVAMKSEGDMKVEGIEGDVEHGLADQLCTELKATTDEDTFMAKVKVLAELVEHHIQEEEEDTLPDFKKESSAEERTELGEKYLTLRTKFTIPEGYTTSDKMLAQLTTMQAKRPKANLLAPRFSNH